jgi:hypothetical protein
VSGDDRVEVECEDPVERRGPLAHRAAGLEVDVRVDAVPEEVARLQHAVLDEEDDEIAVGVAASRVEHAHGLAADRELLLRVEDEVREKLARRLVLPEVGVERLQMLERLRGGDHLRTRHERRVPVRVIEMVVRIEHRHDPLVGQVRDAREDRVALADERHRVDDDHALVGREHADVAADTAHHPDAGPHLLDVEPADPPPRPPGEAHDDERDEQDLLQHAAV